MRDLCVLVLTPFFLIACVVGEPDPEVDYGFESLSGLERRMGDYIEEWSLPSMAGLCVDRGETVLSCALGFRALGSSVCVSDNDVYHIGSVSKSFTGILALLLVEDGTISLESTIAEVLEPDVDVPDDYHEVTLRRLLSHTGRIPDSVPGDAWNSYFAAGESEAREQRTVMARDVMVQAPADATGGGAFLYSNFGFVIAGLMLETAASDAQGDTTSYEDLVQTRIFDVLGMHDAGFGVPASPDTYDQPWGHFGPDARPVNPSGTYRAADNPPGFNPAGRIHASLGDLERYVRMLVDEGAGLLSEGSFEALCQANHVFGGTTGYSLGMYVAGSASTGNLQLYHDGSNKMFYTHLRTYPVIDSAVLLATNWGGDSYENFYPVKTEVLYPFREELYAAILSH